MVKVSDIIHVHVDRNASTQIIWHIHWATHFKNIREECASDWINHSKSSMSVCYLPSHYTYLFLDKRNELSFELLLANNRVRVWQKHKKAVDKTLYALHRHNGGENGCLGGNISWVDTWNWLIKSIHLLIEVLQYSY